LSRRERPDGDDGHGDRLHPRQPAQSLVLNSSFVRFYHCSFSGHRLGADLGNGRIDGIAKPAHDLVDIGGGDDVRGGQ